VSKITNLLIDGFIRGDGGGITRFFNGKAEGWESGARHARLAPRATVCSGPRRSNPDRLGSDKGTGLLYAWDRANGRVVAFDKDKGTFARNTASPTAPEPG